MSIELTVANEVEKSGYQCVSIARYPSEHTCVRAAGMRRLADFLQWSLVRLRYQLFKPGKLYPRWATLPSGWSPRSAGWSLTEDHFFTILQCPRLFFRAGTIFWAIFRISRRYFLYFPLAFNYENLVSCRTVFPPNLLTNPWAAQWLIYHYIET